MVVLLSTQTENLLLSGSARRHMAQPSDAELIERVLQRHKDSFAVLYDRYSAQVFGLATRMLRDDSAAEDATQETFLVLWNKARMYNAEKGALLTWLYRVCRNICLDRLKRPMAKREQAATHAQIAESVHRQWQNYGDRPDYETLHDKVTIALQLLSEREREFIELAFFAGLSHSEIAAAKITPLGTVKSTISAALKKLRGNLGDKWQYNGEW